MGLVEREGIVDAVADHRHDPSLRLQLADQPRLVLGQEVGVVVAEPQRLGDDPARLGVVARQQDHVSHPTSPQRLHRFRRVVAELILQDEHGHQPTVDGDEER